MVDPQLLPRVAGVLIVVLSMPCLSPVGAKAEKAGMIRAAGLVVQKLPREREKNYAEFERLAREAAKQGARIVCTPEGFLEGYAISDRGLSLDRYRDLCEEVPDGKYVRHIRNLARELDIYIVAGLAEKDGKRQYNTSIIVSPSGEIVGKHRKVHNANDEPYNTTGATFSVFKLPFAKVGMMICFDRQMPESARLLATKGAQIIFTPSSGMHGGINDTMMITRAYENGVYVLFVHPEDCLIINPHGDIIARYKGDSRVVIADLDLSLVGDGPISGRKPEVYRDLAK
ncbi:MAG: carbon-nitrogen hydrolase family protein [Armatimonadota bacterium]|nr:carbon-nitrogen hydrolase family protein [Armatimonadota bacterium]